MHLHLFLCKMIELLHLLPELSDGGTAFDAGGGLVDVGDGGGDGVAGQGLDLNNIIMITVFNSYPIQLNFISHNYDPN